MIPRNVQDDAHHARAWPDWTDSLTDLVWLCQAEGVVLIGHQRLERQRAATLRDRGRHPPWSDNTRRPPLVDRPPPHTARNGPLG
jgi:hypothetical protein